MSQDKKTPAITISKGDTTRVVQRSGPVIKVQGRSVSPTDGRGVDLVFVIDTTGSMSDKIEALLATAQRFVDELADLGMSHRVAVVAFGDLTVPGDDIVTFDFTDDIRKVKRTLAGVPRYGGGANDGESSLEALDRAVSLSFRANAIKSIVLITDEPALQHRLSAEGLTKRLVQAEILAFVISPAEPYYKDLARRTGGRWHQVSATADFSNILEMFKQVASKLSRVVADVIKIGGGSVRSYLQLKPPEK